MVIMADHIDTKGHERYLLEAPGIGNQPPSEQQNPHGDTGFDDLAQSRFGPIRTAKFNVRT
jgi:hypothetical protein